MQVRVMSPRMGMLGWSNTFPSKSWKISGKPSCLKQLGRKGVRFMDTASCMMICAAPARTRPTTALGAWPVWPGYAPRLVTKNG